MLSADGCIADFSPDELGCCPPPLCGNDLCCTFVAFFSLLPSGPLWDYWKNAAISYFQASDDPAQCPLLVDPQCPSLILHAIYSVLKLRHVVHGSLWVALRESNPYTAVTTLDDHLSRLQWEDCVAQHCRSNLLGEITPYEIWTECGPLFCPPDFNEDLELALKRNIAIALTRANTTVIKNLCTLNWIIDPLSAGLRPKLVPYVAEPNCDPYGCNTPAKFEIYPTRGWFYGVSDGDVCTANMPLPQVSAKYDRGCNRPAGIPVEIWPGVLAAECIVRSMLLCPANIIRICPEPFTITSPRSITNIENTKLVHNLTSTALVTTWSVVGGPDAAKFELVGALLRWVGDGTKDYEAPDDLNHDNTYQITLRATDGLGLTQDQSLFVHVTNVVEFVITSSATASVAENSLLAHMLTASVSVTWSISGGVDANRFEISGNTLRWIGNGTKNFEAPDDSDGNNIYQVIVRATAGPDSVTQSISITVTDIAELVITSSTTDSVPENSVLVHALTSNIPATWSIISGADAGRFQISGTTLRWLGDGTKDFEAPNDADLNNVYVVTVRATADAENVDQTISVTVTDVDDTAPVITSAATVSVVENAILAHALTADETVTWSLHGGADVFRFEIVSATLRWLANGTKDFELPDDADLNNAYVVTVRATDTAGNYTDQSVTVTVTDVNEFVWLTFAGGINLGMTLSDANTGLAPTTSAVAMSIATNGWKRSGKRYFEVVHTDVGVNGEGVGIVAEGAEIAKVTDSVHPTHCVAVSNVDGRIAARGYPTYPGASIGSVTTAGDRICFAVDLDNWRFWARKGAAGLWNNNASADPATNVGGIDISYWASTRIAPMGMFFSTSFAAGAKWNFNFGDNAFVGAVPSGFIPGWETGCETALGHPTYAYLDFHNTAGNAVIEKGGQLTVKPGSGTEIVHVGVANFKNSGKYYVEFEIIDYTGNSDLWGFVTHDTNDTEVQLGSNCSTVAAGSGAIRSNNASSGLSLGVRADGDIIGAAIDLDADKVWFRVSPSGLWNGQAIGSQNPAANIGGVSISNYTAKGVGPGFCPANFTPPKFILNAGERTFSGTVPLGFTSGWPLNTPDTDPFWSDVVLLTGFERASGFTGTLLDDTNTHIIAINSGTANISAVQKKAGNTSLAVGTAGASVPDHPSLDLSNANTDPFCIELSSYSTNFAGSHNQVYVQGTAGNQAIIIRHKLDGDITFFGSADGTNFWSVSTTGAPLANSVFQDFCYEKDTTGKLRIFVNGVMKGWATPVDSSLFNSSAILALGDGAAAGTKHLDEIRVTKHVRYGSDSSYVPRFLPFPRANATIWSPADVANVTLSGGNLVATSSAATGGVRSNKILRSGTKYYFEVTITGVSTNGLAFGVATAGVNLSTATNTIPGIAVMTRACNIFINGVNQGISLGVPLTVGTIVGVAVDLLSNLIWFRILPVGNWNTSGASTYNPADGTGGFYIGALTGSLHAFFTTAGTGDAVTVNFGATAFAGAVPTGFTAGWPA